MLTVVVRSGLLPQQPDDFPKGCERSCKGALHLKPGTMLMTDGELKHIQKSRPDLSAYLQAVSRTRPAKPPASPVEVHEDPPETETVTEIPGSSETEESKSSRRKRRRFPPDAQ